MFTLKKHKQDKPEAIKQQEQFKKLCQLCSPNFTKEDVLATEVDWPIIWKLALRHRVVPVMADRIKQLDIVVPDDIATMMADNVQQNLFKGMKQAAELVRLTQLFAENDIPFVVFKGIALLKLMGLELHQRHHGDIDVLLADVEDVWKADEALGSIGYERLTLPKNFTLNARQEQYFKDYEKDVIYYHPQRRIHLELHFKVYLSHQLLPISSSEFYKNRSEVEINSTKIPVMSQVDHQIYLLVHGAVSRWCRLKWLCDVPLASVNGQAYLTSQFSQRARTLGIERIATLGIGLANEFFLMPTTPELIKKTELSKKIQLLIRVSKINLSQSVTYSMNLYEKIRFWVVHSFLYMPLLKKDNTYKIDHFKSYMTRMSDWEVLPLSPSLFFLYYPLRPLLWLKRQL